MRQSRGSAAAFPLSPFASPAGAERHARSASPRGASTGTGAEGGRAGRRSGRPAPSDAHAHPPPPRQGNGSARSARPRPRGVLAGESSAAARGFGALGRRDS